MVVVSGLMRPDAQCLWRFFGTYPAQSLEPPAELKDKISQKKAWLEMERISMINLGAKKEKADLFSKFEGVCF